MKYDKIEIARRIRSAREALNMSQSELAEKMDTISPRKEGKTMNYNTIGRWENELNDIIPSLKDMLALCEIFECDLTYLLCEHDTRRRVAADVQKVTGLSEEAIERLRGWVNSDYDDVYLSPVDFVNVLFTGALWSRKKTKKSYIDDILGAFNRLVVLYAPCSKEELRNKDWAKIDHLKIWYIGKIQQSLEELAKAVLDERDTEEMLKLEGEMRDWWASSEDMAEKLKRFQENKYLY